MAEWSVTWTQKVEATESWECVVEAVDLPEAYKKIEAGEFKRKLCVKREPVVLNIDDMEVVKTQPPLSMA